MSDTRDLLIEIGTEELPPKALKSLINAFEKGIAEGLAQADLAFDAITAYAAPRRLAVKVDGLQTAQADRQVERRGPAVAASFDEEGNPTKAVIGFARSCGVDVNDLEKVETDKGAWLVFKQHKIGMTTQSLIGDIIVQALNGLPIPKRMRWGDLPGEFVRPVHWLIVVCVVWKLDYWYVGASAVRPSRCTDLHSGLDFGMMTPMIFDTRLR